MRGPGGKVYAAINTVINHIYFMFSYVLVKSGDRDLSQPETSHTKTACMSFGQNLHNYVIKQTVFLRPRIVLQMRGFLKVSSCIASTQGLTKHSLSVSRF